MSLIHPAAQVAIVLALAAIIGVAVWTHQVSALGAVAAAISTIGGSLLIRSPIVGASIDKAAEK